MLVYPLFRVKSLPIAAFFLVLLGGQGVLGQDPYAPPSNGNQGEQRAQTQSQERDPFIQGISIGVGLAVYQGDLTRNPNHNIVKYIAGSGRLALRAGVDHRLGAYNQYGLGIDLGYHRISEVSSTGLEFQSNMMTLDFYGDYELPYIKQGLFRVFVGGGPYAILTPSYKGFPAQESGNVEQLGPRVVASIKAGLTILDGFRIGTRVTTTDLIDGYKGYNPDGYPDFISFMNLSYRFDLK